MATKQASAKAVATRSEARRKKPAKPKEPVKPVDPYSEKLANMKEEIHALSTIEICVVQRARPCFSTGWLGLDLTSNKFDPATGLPGFPYRTVMEIIARNGSGKTTLALQTAKQMLDANKNNIVLSIFAEEPEGDILEQMNFDSRFMALGCYEAKDHKEHYMLAESCIERATSACRDEDVVALIIDSIPSLVSFGHVYQSGKQKGKDRPMDADETALRAKLLGKLFNRLRVYRRNTSIIMINAITGGPGKMFDGPDMFLETCGGRKKEHEAWIRLELNTTAKYDTEVQKHELFEGYKPSRGLIMRAWVFKNKYCGLQGGRKVIGHFDFAKNRFLNEKYAASYAAYVDQLQKVGNFYHFEEAKANGLDQAQAYLEEHPEEYERLVHAISNKESVEKLFDFKPGNKGRKVKVSSAVRRMYDEEGVEEIADECSVHDEEDADAEEIRQERRTVGSISKERRKRARMQAVK